MPRPIAPRCRFAAPPSSPSNHTGTIPVIAHAIDWLREHGIGVNLHYIPVHTQPYYQQLGFRPGDFPEAKRYYAEAISLPLYPTMTPAQQDEVVEVLKRVVN
ncbi:MULTISPECIES: DegT/DnrJ/EryC1/StrS family aminotransferase [Halomonas]|uniref:DegT/DnrJ/EryC1/StrS aminotransferase family protein n=1 Tax=Halomonas ventosae TaxID=229007 RepID=A0A4R6I3R5_9GAMM|nr:DegT/DnrJ/EryC1/StrS family aminotransferase [Halomonas ventosae]TDO16633.1 DegT/DnrJ/EryC1/StrS aminotransferase family protein [Halomonas ventosae]